MTKISQITGFDVFKNFSGYTNFDEPFKKSLEFLSVCGLLLRMEKLAEVALKNKRVVFIFPSLEHLDYFSGFLKKNGIRHEIFTGKFKFKDSFVLLGFKKLAFLPCNKTVFVVEDEPNPLYKPLRSPYISVRDLLLTRYRYENIGVVFSGVLLSPETGFLRSYNTGNFYVYDTRDKSSFKAMLENIVFENKRFLFIYFSSTKLVCINCRLMAVCSKCEGSVYYINDFKCMCRNTEPICPGCGGRSFIKKSEIKKEEIFGLFSDFSKFSFNVKKYSYGFKFLNEVMGYEYIIAFNFDALFFLPDYNSGFLYYYSLYRLLDAVKNVVVITENPGYYPVKFLKDPSEFYARELDLRKKYSLPPFVNMIEVFLSGIKQPVQEKDRYIFKTKNVNEIPVFIEKFRNSIKKIDVLFVKI